MKALLLILCPALTFAATITSGVACSGNALNPTVVSSGSSIQCRGPYSSAGASASITETASAISATLGVFGSWNQPLQQPYDGPAHASATITDSVVAQGTGTGYVRIVPAFTVVWDPNGGTGTVQLSINGTQEFICWAPCPDIPIFAPITLGSPVLFTFSANANDADLGSGTSIGGSVALLFFGSDQVTPVGISDVSVPEPSGVLLTLVGLAGFALVGTRIRRRHRLGCSSGV